MKSALQCVLDHLLAPDDSQPLVVIVGAGVSTEVGLPTGGELVSTILDPTPPNGVYADQIKNRLSLPSQRDFFSVLGTLRECAREKVISEPDFNRALDEWFHHKEGEHPPAVSESYELLGHLLHHRKISAIVSLNFDEYLDHSLELELHNDISQFLPSAIASRSEFGRLIEHLEESDKPLPRAYLKPHGTISRKLTMRYSPDQVWRLDAPQQEVLERYLDGALVLTLGWGLGDQNLVRILHRTAKTVVVDINDRTKDLPNILNLQFYRSTALEVLRQLVDAERPMEIHRNQQTRLKGLRHKIRGAVFGVSQNTHGNTDAPLVTPSRQNQLIVEIAIFALKARGQFRPEVLMDCPRIAFFYGQRQKPSATLIGEQLQKLVECGALKRYHMPKSGKPIYSINYQPENGEIADDVLTRSARKVVTEVLSILAPEADSDATGRVFELMQDLTHSFDIDVAIIPKELAMFSSGSPISHRVQFIKATNEILEKSGIDSSLFVSTYTGEWLVGYVHELKFRHITVLLDNFDLCPEPYRTIAKGRADELYDQLFRAKCYFDFKLVDAKSHNITMVCDPANGLLDALYFHRHSKTTSVSPLRLTAGDNPQDREQLQKLWAGMDKRAESYQPKRYR